MKKSSRTTTTTARSSSAKKKPAKKATEKQTERPISSEVTRDLTLIGCFAVCVLLFIANLGFGGVVGNALSTFFFGLFGVMAYALPFVLFFGTSFYIANRNNALIVRKMVGLVIIFLFLCVFFQILSTGYIQRTPVADYYRISAREHSGGGIFGGLFTKLFGFAFGGVGAAVLTLVGLVLGAVILTQRPLISEFRNRSKDRFREARIRRRTRKAKALPKRKERVEERPEPAAYPTSLELEPSLDLDLDPAIFASLPETVPDLDETENLILPAVEAEADLPAPKKEKEAAVVSKKELDQEKAAFTKEVEKRSPVRKQYRLPSTRLLKKGAKGRGDSKEHLMGTARKLQETFHDFGVNVRVTDVSRGPTVTRFELQPEHGVKVAKILSLSDDIKLSLATSDIRIEAPIPGKAAIGIEVPNKENSPVMLRELLDSDAYKSFKKPLAFAVGKDIGGKPIIADISSMPHLLIAGATGSGKSVCINSLIVSLLFKYSPEEVRLLMIDPKVVELKMYNGIPHLLHEVVTDPKKASGALNWAVVEMTKRYEQFAEYNGVRDIDAYNERVRQINEDPAVEEKIPTMPRIVIIVDELADLMMVAPGEVEDAICRLAQLARAAGMHLILATQRPSVNVVTGLIKANMPSRIALSVSSGIDSRTIIDMNGAEKLLGKGDMLFYPQGYSKPSRVQGAYISDDDIAEVVSFLSEQKVVKEEDEIIDANIAEALNHSPSIGPGQSADDDRDEYFWEAGKLIIDKDKASIGMLQRVFKIGFNRAARIMDQLHEAGVVSEEDGTKPRNILMTAEQFENLQIEQG